MIDFVSTFCGIFLCHRLKRTNPGVLFGLKISQNIGFCLKICRKVWSSKLLNLANQNVKIYLCKRQLHWMCMYIIGAKDDEISCCVCQTDQSEKPNEIVLCDNCGLGNYQIRVINKQLYLYDEINLLLKKRNISRGYQYYFRMN